MRRHVSVDFTVPHEYRESLRLSAADEFAVPLGLLTKRPLVHFDLRNEEGHSIPLLTAEQNTAINRELLYQVLDVDLADQDAGEATQEAVALAAGPVIEAVLGDGADAGAVAQLERDHELAPLTEFRAMAASLSRYFVLWAVVRGLDRRRVFKFAYDEPFSQRPGLTPTCFYECARLRRGVELPRRGGGAAGPQGAHHASGGRGDRRGARHRRARLPTGPRSTTPPTRRVRRCCRRSWSATARSAGGSSARLRSWPPSSRCS